jgi:hypothetical protein
VQGFSCPCGDLDGPAVRAVCSAGPRRVPSLPPIFFLFHLSRLSILLIVESLNEKPPPSAPGTRASEGESQPGALGGPLPAAYSPLRPVSVPSRDASSG